VDRDPVVQEARRVKAMVLAREFGGLAPGKIYEVSMQTRKPT